MREPGLSPFRWSWGPVGRLRSHEQVSGQPGQRRFLLSFCATLAFTSFLTSAVGRGLSMGKWMVPLDVEKPLSSFLYASITDAVGNKLQWFENAANHTSTPLCLCPASAGTGEGVLPLR